MTTNFNYALDQYSWCGALSWGNFLVHCQKVKEGTWGDRIVHVLIAMVEFLPILSQIASLFEKLIVESFKKDPAVLPPRTIELDQIETIDSTQSSITEQLDYFRKLPRCKLFGEQDEQVEIALDGERVGRNTITSLWKLHISANHENAGQVIEAIKGVLLRHRPHFKLVRTEELLEEYNSFINPAFPERGRFKEGKFITIYGKNDAEILHLAEALDKALKKAIVEQKLCYSSYAAVNRTDRPIGTTCFLWARHDQAGCPITDIDFTEGTHAAAKTGNYNVTTHFPIDWVDLSAQEMDRRIKLGQGTTTVTHPDIFESRWGKVYWDRDLELFMSV